MKAVEGGNVDMVKLLLEHGANGEYKGGHNCALTMACERGNIEVVKTLLPISAQAVAQTDKFGTGDASGEGRWNCTYAISPVNTAVDYGNTELVKWFLEGALGVKVPLGALFLAIIRKHGLALVELLLKHGANVNEKGKHGWSALMIASYYGEPEIMQALLKHGAEIDHQSDTSNSRKQSALVVATKRRQIEAVKVLLAEGAQVDLKDEFGSTALMCAMEQNYDIIKFSEIRKMKQRRIDVIKLLLDGGADVNSESDSGRTVLTLAARHEQPEIVALLLEKGASINHQSSNGDYPLKIAVSMSNFETTKILLKAGAKVDTQDQLGKSLLMDNFVSLQPQMFELLLDYGVPTDLQDNDGNYALLKVLGFQTRNYDVIGLLLEKGADPNLMPDNGATASSILQRDANYILVSLPTIV